MIQVKAAFPLLRSKLYSTRFTQEILVLYRTINEEYYSHQQLHFIETVMILIIHDSDNAILSIRDLKMRGLDSYQRGRFTQRQISSRNSCVSVFNSSPSPVRVYFFKAKSVHLLGFQGYNLRVVYFKQLEFTV